MKIIEFNPKQQYADNAYRILDNVLEFGMNYLPFIFLKKVYLDGYKIYLPRWISRKRMDQIDKRTQEFMNNINWEK